MGTTSTGAGGSGSGFVEPMGEDCLGMRRGPAVRQHLFQTRIVRMQAEQEIADVDPGLDTMTLGARQDRVQHGGSRPRGFAAQEEPILASEGLVTQCPLTDVIVDRQTAILRVATQRLPLVAGVGHGFGQTAFGKCPRSQLSQVRFDLDFCNPALQ